MHKKKKRNPAESRLIAQLKGDLLTNSNFGRALRRVQDATTIPLVDEILQWVKSEHRLETQLSHRLFPKTLRKLEPKVISTPKNHVEVYMRWVSALIRLYSGQIVDFIKLKNEFECKMLTNDFFGCHKILEQTQEMFGHSYWQLSNQIALFQASDGLEAQKQFTNGVKEDSEKNGFVAFVAHHLSVRNEISVSAARFQNILNRSFAVSESDPASRLVINNLLMPSVLSSDDQISSVLFFSNESSLIDSYEALMGVLQSIVVLDRKHLRSSASLIVQRLSSLIDDFRLEALKFELSSNVPNCIRNNVWSVEVLESFLAQDYPKCLSLGISMLKLEPGNFDVWEIIATCQAISPEASTDNWEACVDGSSVSSIALYQRLINSMSLLLKERDENFEKIYWELIKVSLNYDSHSWAKGLSGFLWEQETSVAVPSEDIRIRYASLSHKYLHPLRLPTLDTNKNQIRYLDAIKKEYHKFPLSLKYSALNVSIDPSGSGRSISSNEGFLLNAELLYRQEKYEESLTSARKLCESELPYYRYRGIRITANCLIFLGDINEAVTFVSKTLVSEPRLHSIVPLEDLVEFIIESGDYQFTGSIHYPILLNFYSLNKDDRYNHVRNYACEDFLSDNGLERPSDLRKIESNFERAILIYFLKTVAIESTIDMSLSFQDSREVADERLQICKFLIELDPNGIEEYQAEIKEINRRMMLQQRIREIEQSKIYIDTEKIRRKVSPSLRESLNRYQTFLQLNFTPQAKLIEEMKSLFRSEGREIVFLSIPEDEIAQILESMFSEVLEEYVSSSEHGLDAYLSIRIRHGTLSGQMRSPLEASHLITQRNSKTQQYKDNEYWTSFVERQEKFRSLNPAYSSDVTKFVREMNRELAVFSMAFDSLITEILSSYIQVKSRPEGVGLFDFIFDRRKVGYMLTSKVTKESTVDMFFDLVIEILEIRLNSCLEKIRPQFAESIKQQIIDLLDDLHDRVEKLGAEFNISINELTNAIRSSRTGVSTVIDRIAEWFTLSKSLAKDPFRFEDAISISEATVRITDSSFNPHIHVAEDLPLLDGKLLDGMVDIFINVFANIVKHGGNVELQNAEVNIVKVDDLFTIDIINDVDQSVLNEAIESKLERIRAGIREGAYMNSVRSEGGTGFNKIMKILKHDIGINASIEFGFKEENRFFTRITMPLQVIFLSYSDNQKGLSR